MELSETSMPVSLAHWYVLALNSLYRTGKRELYSETLFNRIQERFYVQQTNLRWLRR